MSADFAFNIMPTGDYGDNAVWPQKPIYTISSSCDNRTPSTWYINEAADETTRVTAVAPIQADVAALQTINESGDFTEEQNKISIQDLSKNINECNNTEKKSTKNVRREFHNKKYYNIPNKHLTSDEELGQFYANIEQTEFKKNSKKSASFDCFEDYNGYFVIKNNDKCLQTISGNISKKMDEKLNKNIYKHVPHKDRPPLIVARRNARERRRVQAVNSAFMKLRKIVPIGNNRGKRISKVKTLQTAIDYISNLQALLKETDMYDMNIISNYHCCINDFMEDEF